MQNRKQTTGIVLLAILIFGAVWMLPSVGKAVGPIGGEVEGEWLPTPESLARSEALGCPAEGKVCMQWCVQGVPTNGFMCLYP